MKFGKASPDDLGQLQFNLPPVRQFNKQSLPANERLPSIRVGTPGFSKAILKDFYPRGTKDLLGYYSQHFSTIEQNSTFYKMPTSEKIKEDCNKSAPGFLFFPKMLNSISQYRRLVNCEELTTQFIAAIAEYKEKLEGVFLQMPDNFSMDRWVNLQKYIRDWPKEIALAVELRHPSYYEEAAQKEVAEYFRTHQVSWMMSDTAMRRDVLHMNATSTQLLVRFNAIHLTEIDDMRLIEWVDRIYDFWKMGVSQFNFFIHQDYSFQHPFLAARFLQLCKSKFDLDIPISDVLLLRSY